MQNIAILGYGRSGTTWISDIISKVTGTLLLFEPFNKGVDEAAAALAYREVTQAGDKEVLKRFFDSLMDKKYKSRWLVRNHLPFPMEQISDNFLDTLYDECRVTGFKAIRASWMPDFFHEDMGYKVVFVIRHPCAVAASIKKRFSFWNEYGWPQTYDLFLSRTVYNGNRAAKYSGIVEGVEDYIGKIAVMWSVTHVVALEKLERLGLPLFYYEDFYREPFKYVRELFDYIGYDNVDIHPSHMFTPSMTTLRTIHGLYDKESDLVEKGARAFWENDLTDREVDMILDIVRQFGIDLYDRGGSPVRSR